MERSICTSTSNFRSFQTVFLILVFFAMASAVWATEEKDVSEAAGESTSENAEKESAEKAYSNRLKWSTASEVDNFGFDIFRSEEEEGPFDLVNPEPIPGQGTTDEPTFYEYVDDTIDPTKAYYYYIESISLSNEREKFTPTFRAKPKLPVEE